jgi:hypothetical protein
MRATHTLPLLALFTTLAGVAHADGDFSLTPAIDHTSGRYGTASVTDITTTSVMGKYETDDWTFKLTVPYLVVRGGAGVVPGVGGTANTNPQRRREGEAVSGLGDVVGSATYTAYDDDANDFSVDLTGKVKLGTASRDKGLGTGANDYTAQVDLYKGYSALTVFAGAGYTVMGSTPYMELNNVFSVSAGASYRTSDTRSVGLSYDGRQAPSSTAGAISEATLYLNQKMSDTWRSQFYVLKGFATGSPDWGFGASASRYF